jgi:hypothetical protein
MELEAEKALVVQMVILGIILFTATLTPCLIFALGENRFLWYRNW